MNKQKEELEKLWQNLLLLTGKSTKSIAGDTNQSQQNLSKKINNYSIRYIELLYILNKYGYTLEIKKNNE